MIIANIDKLLDAISEIVHDTDRPPANETGQKIRELAAARNLLDDFDEFLSWFEGE